MKLLFLLITLSLIQACDPYGFGFKKNPAYIVNAAFESMLNLNTDAFVEVTGKEALCLYGNPDGLAYLKEHLNIDPNKLDLKPKLIEDSSRYTNNPHFVGYWSYYNEKYELDVSDKQSDQELLKVVVECHYGFDGDKSESYRNLKLSKYKKKECRMIKISPLHFEGIPVNQNCENLLVEL